MTFRTYIEYHWFPNLTRRQVRPSTMSSYASMLERHVYPQWASEELATLTPSRVELLLNSMRDYSPKYQRNVAMLLRAAFHHAVESGVLPNSPVRDYHMPKVHRHEKPVWSPAEISRLLEAFAAPYKILFSIAVSTGIRVGELLALTWDDIDFNSRGIHIRHSLWSGRSFAPKTDASRRFIPMPESLSAALQAHREQEAKRWPAPLSGCDFVFRNDLGKPLCAGVLRRDVLYPALERLGMNWNKGDSGFHRFRHSVASIIVSQTGNLKLAQQILGHSSITTTADIYTHVAEPETREAIQGLAQVIAARAPGVHPILPANQEAA